MAIRNLSEIGENLLIIVKRLMANLNLLKFLYYTDKDPLSHPDLTLEQIANEVYGELLLIVPRVGALEDAKSVVVVRVSDGVKNFNTEFCDIIIKIEVFVPLTLWIIKSDNLRPFHIMGEIQKSIEDKEINGLGKILGGDFSFNFVSEEITAFQMTFLITQYE